ncbi:MAG: endonuclease/exonuclease/phosphatase family protein [Prosthecobacter sp.]|nr:endonuclease/exonuclease/phosphatase family protein [Prosthecobacter sp.]
MIRIMTYNVHGCVGCDGRLDHARIAEVIAAEGADVVALQELDVSRERSGRVHQARIIADLLAMQFHFHPAHRIREEEEYGDALLARWPLRLRRAAELPTVKERLAFEPRGALWASITVNGREIQVINTHLGLSNNERKAQIAALMGAGWLQHADCTPPRVLCGDFNALPCSAVYKRACRGMSDTQRMLPGQRPKATFPSRWPLVRLDYIFVSAGFTCDQVRVVNTPLARVASDHLPLVADLHLPTEAEFKAET